jgi:hypothetical protein
MTSAFRDDSSWAYSHKPAEPQEDACTTLASTALTKRPPAVTAPEQAADALTGMLLTSPTKKARMSGGGEAATTSVAGYSPELTKALKSVVKVCSAAQALVLCSLATAGAWS